MCACAYGLIYVCIYRLVSEGRSLSEADDTYFRNYSLHLYQCFPTYFTGRFIAVQTFENFLLNMPVPQHGIYGLLSNGVKYLPNNHLCKCALYAYLMTTGCT